MTELVAAAVSSDGAEYQATGFRPVAFETAAQGIVPLEADASSVFLKVHGTLDRVDYRAEPPALRIVDYKFKQGSEITALDRNLALSAVRGFRLQPPLYARMTLPLFSCSSWLRSGSSRSLAQHLTRVSGPATRVT